jgi:8-amino-7-oxononanoate synthase
VQYLRYTCGGFVYSVGMPPASAGAALAALRVLDAEPTRVRRLQEVSARFAALARERGLDIGRSAHSAVVPVIVGSSARALAVAAALERHGVLAVPMIAPSVEEGRARLRFFLSAEHTDSDVECAVSALVAATEAVP